MTRIALLALLVSGCAVRHAGFCHGTPDGGAELRALDGTIFPLTLTPDSAPLAYLDGHSTQIEGTQVFKKIRVTDWNVYDGLHGLPAWVGPIQAYGPELGIQDRNSGVFYFLDPAAARHLEGHIGDVVLLEGWVEDARRVKVAYFRVLAETTDEEAPPEAP